MTDLDHMGAPAADPASGRDPTGVYLTREDDVYVYEGGGSRWEFTVYGLGGDDEITGSINLRAIRGGAGDDTLHGASSFEARGGSGDDLIYGTTRRSTVGSEHLYGGTGDDHIVQLGGASYIDGGAGDDTIDLGLFFCRLSGGAGDDVVNYAQVVEAGSRRLSLGAGDDVVDGSTSFDRSASGGVETFGGGGNDTVIAGAGFDRFDGGSGIDEISYAFERSGVTIDLRSGVNGGAAATDVLSKVENVTGSGFDDQLAGDGGANVLNGLGGADVLRGRGGDDLIVGGDGADVLRGGAGADTLIGGAGADIFYYDDFDEIVDFNPDEGDVLIYRPRDGSKAHEVVADWLQRHQEVAPDAADHHDAFW
ncbi:calcium-binding protein [Chenggangzhangella methanolivorans]|uniref:Calcium-binding protein n=1 Tax=Chenggangzhangella methanolivorans TaxID=1437009 RepID=A0A9E6R6X6_9HYPH|nr:calcium-binding protein [Chenggangzhangella methanolivorans]QZN98944.1 hypothetical protein K6K41_18840 [Chenggangzhangella methanolivorans]